MHDSEVIAIDDQGSSGTYVSISNKDKLQARNVVVAAGSWSGKLMRKSGYKLPMQDGKGYSMTLSNPPLKPSIPSILHEARVAITPMGNDLRISGTLEISGMDDIINQHKVDSILHAVPEYYPQLKIHTPGPVWFGYRPCTPDGLPYIGRWKDGSSVIIATGHAMMGLSLAPVTGRMVSDIVSSQDSVSPAAKLNPSRFS
jgi:D-amino-acid dehydrogenase